MARKLVDDYGGEVPSDIDSLLTLPGVGRKTANVILAVAYELPAMAVDTHVFRVSERIGLTRDSKTPLQTEETLMKYIPEDIIPKAHHWLILHGRYVCKARKPLCESCGLRSFCRYYPIEQKRLEKEAIAKLKKQEEKRKQKEKEAAARKKPKPKKNPTQSPSSPTYPSSPKSSPRPQSSLNCQWMIIDQMIITTARSATIAWLKCSCDAKASGAGGDDRLGL